MRYLAVLIVLFAVVALPAAKKRQSGPIELYGGPQAVVIYRKLMPLPINGKALLLVSTTRTAGCKNIRSEAEPAAGYAEALADFKRVNLQAHDLRSLLTPEHPQLISERDLQSLFHGNVEEGWKKFYRNNPTRLDILLSLQLASTRQERWLLFTRRLSAVRYVAMASYVF